MPDKQFTHLHLHTEYSFLDGFSKVWNTAAKEPGALIERLEYLGQKNCAITDHGTTAGWVRFDKACKSKGINPIFGVEGYFCNDRNIKGLTEEQKLRATRGIAKGKTRETTRAEEKRLGLSRRSHFCSWAMNKKGIYEIQKTMSIAARQGFHFRPRWDFDLIKRMKNCMFGSACAGGVINYHLNVDDPSKDDIDGAYEEAKKWKKELGDRFYVELMAIDWEKGARIDKIAYDIAKSLEIPIIITNDSHYVKPSDYEPHDVLLALQSNRDYKELGNALKNPNRMRYDMQDLFVKSRKQMYNSFLKHHSWVSKSEVSEMLDRTNEIAERATHNIIKKNMIMPKIKVPKVTLKGKKNDFDPQIKYLYKLCGDGWKKKIIPWVKEERYAEYKARLNEELGMIIKQGFTPYFLLCNKLMVWTDSQNIARGPARGSSAGSLVAYLLDITMIDPIPYDLLFSRFIDPNRSDYPDVDMDFEDSRRREVITYFIEEYGINNVAILGNNMLFKSKMALKDIARLYDVPLRETQEVCNLIIERSGADSRASFCLEDTFDQFDFAKLYKKKYPKVAKTAGIFEGMTKAQGVHAAGVIIADGNISQYTATRLDKKNPEFPVSLIDKHDAEDLGLLKMDILGLNTMAVLAEAQKLVKENSGKLIGFESIVQDVMYKGGDEDVYKSFAEAHTVGVFQFSSPGLTRLSKQVKIQNFQEISDCTALHRPGPIHSGAMNQYPRLKFGTLKAEKALHPIIEKYTKRTYGLIIYQEQVMQIVRELGDFDWGQTNTVRKVMSKSGGAEYFMKTFWPTFKKGCMDKGLTESQALEAFKSIMSFGSWAFNFSHSLSYAMVSYMCMFFKVKYPAEYCTAFLNKVNDTGGDKKKAMVKDIARLGIPLREVNVNHSGRTFIIKDNAIIVGLSDIKNVGTKAVDTIIENQPYSGLGDFLEKVNSRACNKRSVENLIKAGAFSDFGYNVKKLIDSFELIHKEAKKKSPKAREKVQELLADCKGGKDYNNQERAELKQKATPVSVGKHLTEFYGDVEKKVGKHIDIVKLSEIELEDAETAVESKERDENTYKTQDVTIIGLLTSVDLKRLSQEVKDVMNEAEEKRYALANLEDGTDFIVASFKEDIYYKYEQKLYEWIGKVMLVRGKVRVGVKKLYVTEVQIMDEMRDYIKKDMKPYDLEKDYYFRHPLTRWVKDLTAFRMKHKLLTNSRLLTMRRPEPIKILGYVCGMRELTVKKEGKNKGKKFYNIQFEDETFVSNFIIWPNDPRLKELTPIMKRSFEKREPIILTLEKTMDYDKSFGTGKQSAQLPKGILVKDVCKTFKIKEKK